jgi:hypothetical protein
MIDFSAKDIAFVILEAQTCVPGTEWDLNTKKEDVEMTSSFPLGYLADLRVQLDQII